MTDDIFQFIKDKHPQYILTGIHAIGIIAQTQELTNRVYSYRLLSRYLVDPSQQLRKAAGLELAKNSPNTIRVIPDPSKVTIVSDETDAKLVLEWIELKPQELIELKYPHHFLDTTFL